MSTAERRAREKAQRRQEILSAARQEFFERGSHRPTVDAVAARAEVSKGTIYLYYESKEGILAHLLLEGLDLLVKEMEAVCDPGQPPEAECTLQELANAYLRFCQSNPSYFRLIMAFDRGRFEESISRELHQQVMNKSLHGLDLLARTEGRAMLVSHQVNISALTGRGTRSGEVLILRVTDDTVKVLGSILLEP